MAIYGSLGEVDLGALDASISDTAVDIFVYDTSKDSDGGAWRKRTQHTSWYNETLNTSTRGSRREFPAVAVIVIELNTLIIYDGDDPDLPMWMKFERDSSGSSKFLTANRTNTAVTAVNGIIAWCDTTDAQILKFIEDAMYLYGGSGLYSPNTYIANRNNTSAVNFTIIDSTKLILNAACNDIAMTVLPNAPIDPPTGLPIPTIAVATDGGVNVIKDDGSVVDFSHTSAYNDATGIQFLDDNSLILMGQNSGAQTNDHWAQIFNIPSSDESASGWSNLASALREYASPIGGTLINNIALTPTDYSNSGSEIVDFYKNKAFGYNDRLTFLYDVAESPTSSSVAYATTSYNTGWMHGDIKGAFLSDTDATNVTGTELHPNGNSNFSSTDVSYISNSASGTATVVSGQLVLSGGTAGYSDHIININTEVGAKYIITIDYVTNNGSNGNIGMYVNNTYLKEANDGNGYAVRSTGNSYTWYFTADNTTENIDLVTAGSSSNTYTFDNWSIKKVEEDRSVNNKGLQVFGTVTKSAVATGAELVAYSGYSASNYLVQPSISAPGTGDFSVSAWIKPGSADGTGGNYFHLFSLGTSSTGGQSSSTGFVLKFAAYSGANSSGFVPYFFNNDGGTSHGTFDANNYLPLGVWGQIVAGRQNGVPYIYLNGKLVKTGNSWTTNLTDTYLTVFLGLSQTNEVGGEAEVSLLRYSLSAPSAEQIKKIYEDEKVLFQENAACTLYGSSDAVTALAYDDSTNLLYAGTSSGRSDFQGLRRINNTTTAVTTAISASNGLVAEQ